MFVIYIPTIKDANFSKNPCDTNEEVKLLISVEDVKKILYPEVRYSGEIYSNEV